MAGAWGGKRAKTYSTVRFALRINNKSDESEEAEKPAIPSIPVAATSKLISLLLNLYY